MPFETGPHVNPFSAAAREGLQLLESVTPIQLAAAVPRIIITKIDIRTGHPVEDVRPLMFDLVQTPQFGPAGQPEFGVDRDRFFERATVSLMSLDVKTQLTVIGSLREVTLKFTVHRPDIVFDRDSKIPWREILEEGKSFSLEYGWSADPVACPNDLFNGYGHVSDSGAVIRASQTMLLNVSRWFVNLKQSGEVDVTVFASENGDIALRETRFADVAGAVLGVEVKSDDDAARSLFNRLKNVTPTILINKGKFFKLGDVMDELAAPMIEEAIRRFGYRGNPPVRMRLANFNMRAGRQSKAWGWRHMGGITSIAEFLIPADRLVAEFSKHVASGRSMKLREFLEHIINFLNSNEAWSREVGQAKRPHIGVRYETIRVAEGITLVMTVLDRNAVGDNVDTLKRLPLDRQTKEAILLSLESSQVPVIEFSRAGSLILDASFEMQPNTMLQSIQIETAEKGRKNLVEKAATTDVESRKGYAFPKDIVPISILEGDITFHGNFVLNPYDRIWIEFFGSSSISGIFNVIDKNDHVEAGKFTSQFHLISEGIDPMNTRFRFTDEELKTREKK